MEKKLKILVWEETNPHYNSRTANNGGGYSQPHIQFEYDGIVGELDDTSCGDFGSRWSLEWAGKVYDIDQVNCDEERYSSFTEADEEFIKAIVSMGYLVRTAEELREMGF